MAPPGRGDVEALGAARLYPDLFRAERVEVLRLTQAAEERAQREPQQPEAARAVRDVEAQTPRAQTRAPAHARAFDFVLVVADEDERRVTHNLFAVGVQADVQERVAAHDGERR